MLPTGGNKRKLSDHPTPEMLKKMKVEVPLLPSNSSSNTLQHHTSQDNGQKRTATREYEEVVGIERDFAPGGDADYFAEEDDEGRFFGGGLTMEQKEILNIFETAGGEGVQDDVSVFSWKIICLIDCAESRLFSAGRVDYRRNSETIITL
jgi:beta-catenin-like protein 1